MKKTSWLLAMILLFAVFIFPNDAFAEELSTEEAVYALLQHNIVKIDIDPKAFDQRLEDIGMTYAAFDGYKHSLKYYYYKERPGEYYIHVVLNPDEGNKRLAVFEKIQGIRSKALETPGPVTQLEFANNYLVDHVAYDEAVYESYLKGAPMTDLSPWSAEGALLNGKAVCEGYAGAFMMICDQLGIPCVKVNGELNGIPHTWNSVFIESIQDWLNVDVTNNDPGNTKVPEGFRTHLFLLTDDQYSNYGYQWNKKRAQAIKDIRFPYLVGNQLDYLRRQKIIVGRGDADFAAAAQLTREELAAILVRISDKNLSKPAQTSAIADVSDWAQESVQVCKANGLMVGYPDGSFKGKNPVSKQELAAIMLRLSKVPSNAYRWETVEQTAVAHDLMSAGRTSGIITATASRADIFDVLYRLLHQ